MKIICPRLSAVDMQDCGAVRAVFAEAPVLRMGQAWLPQPEKRFLPAEVRLGWYDDRLLIFGELHNNTPLTRAAKDNQLLCSLGDAFEIFLGDQEHETYAEFHIAPNGTRLQLLWPDGGTFQRVCHKEISFEDCLVGEPLFAFSQWVEDNKWHIIASVPSSVLLTQGAPLVGRTWRVSFSRYDYVSAEEPPVLSSTSSHAEMSFHRQHEWTEIEFR